MCIPARGNALAHTLGSAELNKETADNHGFQLHTIFTGRVEYSDLSQTPRRRPHRLPRQCPVACDEDTANHSNGLVRDSHPLPRPSPRLKLCEYHPTSGSHAVNSAHIPAIYRMTTANSGTSGRWRCVGRWLRKVIECG